MPIPEKIIDQVLESTDIVDVIGRYVPLKKAGRNYKAPCPFHHEKTPSFVVSPDKQIYHCFGCGAGGNVFSFLMKHENMQFPEAVETLAAKAGIVLPRDITGRGGSDAFTDGLYKINELACQFFQIHLEKSGAAKEYLASRGIGQELIKKFRIGSSPDAWEGLLNFFKSKKISADVLEKSGLVVSNQRGGHYDRFRNRIIFPIIDLRQRVLGFGGRVMDTALPKYINSPETPIYSKGRNLYGLNQSKEFVKKTGYTLIVEGYLDFLVPYQAGIQNIIATLGTALTVDQIKLIKRFAHTVVTLYDPDEAGEIASLRSLELFISEGVNVYIAQLPKGFDPDTYIRRFGASEFSGIIKSAKNMLEYKFEKLTNRHNAGTTHGKAAIVSEMLPTIAKIENEVSKSELVKKLAEKLSVDEDAVRAELKKVKAGVVSPRASVVPAQIRRDATKAEMILLAILLDGGIYIERATHALPLEEIRNSTVRDIISEIFRLHRQNKEVNPSRLMNNIGANVMATAIISEAVSLSDMLVDKDKALEDCIARIKKENILQKLNALQDAIKLAHSSNDKDKLNNLLTEYNGLIKIAKV